MLDLKVINSVLTQLEEERGIPKEKIIDAIEVALGTAYKKEYGKKGQVIKAKFDMNSGDVEFFQVKQVVDKDSVVIIEEDSEELAEEIKAKLEEQNKDGEYKVRFNPEHHILIEDAKLIKKDAEIDEEVIFPLDKKDDFGRIAAQTAKQVITQKIREAEKLSVIAEFGEKEGQIVSGTVERSERGNVYIDMGRAVGMIGYNEQIPGERFSQGERIRAYLFKVDESAKGVFLKLSRSHPKFLEELFKSEVPEIESGIVEIKSIAREAGSRSKIAVRSTEENIDPVGSMVGQRGVRVSTITSELGGEKLDIIEWSEDPVQYIEEALSPAKIIDIKTSEKKVERDYSKYRKDGDKERSADDKYDIERVAEVLVSEDQLSLAIGKGGQNVRLAAKLTGWKIDIKSIGNNSEEDPASQDRDDVSETEAPIEDVPVKEESSSENTENQKEEITEENEAPIKVEDSLEDKDLETEVEEEEEEEEEEEAEEDKN